MLKNIRLKVTAARPHLLRSGWASVEALVSPVLFFALSPWLLHSLGVTGFGQWMLALTIAGFAHVASLGAGVSTMYAVAGFQAKGEIEKALDTIRAGFTLALITSVVLMTCALFISNPIAETVFSKMGNSHIVANILLLGVSALILQEIDAVYAGALRGMQRYDLVALLELFGRPIWALSIVIATFSTNNVSVILITHNIYYLLRLIVRVRMVAFVFKKNCFGFPIGIQSVINIANFGKWVSLQSIGGILFSTIDKFFVGWLLGSGELARYSICLQVVQFSHALQASALQVITPWVASKRTKVNLSKNQYNFFFFSLWAGLGSLFFPLLMISVSSLLLRIWMGHSFADDNIELLRILLLGMAILAFTIPAHYVLLGLGRAKFSAILLVVAGLFSLTFSVALSAFGLLGFAIGRMLYGVVACFYFVPIWRTNSEISRS